MGGEARRALTLASSDGHYHSYHRHCNNRHRNRNLQPQPQLALPPSTTATLTRNAYTQLPGRVWTCWHRTSTEPPTCRQRCAPPFCSRAAAADSMDSSQAHLLCKQAPTHIPPPPSSHCMQVNHCRRHYALHRPWPGHDRICCPLRIGPQQHLSQTGPNRHATRGMV